MANTVKHKFTSLVPDDPDSTIVRPSNWNDEHAFSGGNPLYYLMWSAGASDKVTFDNIWARLPLLDITKPPYNADATGVVDMTATFNSALTALGNAGGGLIWLPPDSTFLLNSSAKLQNSTGIIGCGSSSVLKLGTSATVSAIENAGYDTSSPNLNLLLKDFAIDANRATPPGSFTSFERNIWQPSTAFQVGDYVANTTTGFRIYLCATAGTSAASTGPTGTGSGIVDGTCIWNYVEDLWTSTSDPNGHQAGVLFSRVTNALLENVHCYMSRDNGFIFELCQDGRISNCHLSDINKNGIYLSNNEHTTVVGCDFQYSYSGIGAAAEWYSSLTGNVGGTCINNFISTGRDVQFCSITGNSGGNSGPTVTTGGGDFVVIAESITGTAHGKTYPGSFGEFEYGMYNCSVVGNSFSRIQLHVSNDNLVAHNVIQNARRDGVHLLGSANNTIAFNAVYNGGSATLGPWAYANLVSSGGSLQPTLESTGNRFLYNSVHDDRNNDGLQRWGFTFTGSPVNIQLMGNVVNLDNNVTLPIRFYNWNVDYGVFRDNYYGNGSGILKFLPASIPTAREELRGDIWVTNGGVGVLDRYSICIKNASDTYEYVEIPPFVPKNSFTLTGTGFSGTDPTVTAVYQILGGYVHMYIPILTGTSDATSFTLTGIPVGIQPNRNSFMTVRIADNGTDALGLIAFAASTNIFAVYPTVGLGSWTGSGTKTLYAVNVYWTTGAF